MRKYYYSLFLSWVSRDNEKNAAMKLSQTHCHLTNSLSPVPCFLSINATSGDKGVSEADSFCSLDPR